jgi:hypothetical protein
MEFDDDEIYFIADHNTDPNMSGRMIGLYSYAIDFIGERDEQSYIIKRCLYGPYDDVDYNLSIYYLYIGKE